MGTDYQVGPDSGQLASLADVPWESLQSGDTVRIFHSPTPYAGKFIIAAQAAENAPVRICGVKSASGERPVITGENAVTRRALQNLYGSASNSALHQSRSVIIIKPLNGQPWEAYPHNIQIDGLKIRSAHPNYRFTDASGASKTYTDFGACVWVERGENITIADNEITDCSQGIFSRSTPDGDFAVTKNLRIAGNTFTNNGIVGDEHMHSTYIQSHGVIYEFNRYGSLRSGSTGSALKDRSVGAVIRYNRIEDGARALDMVEAEDYSDYALAQPEYHITYVYGNQIVKDGRTGSTIHYGGDHPFWNEPRYRKGTLYFFNNTVHQTGTEAAVFQLSTTEEYAEIWNNIFIFDDRIRYPRLRQGTDVDRAYTMGGILNFGVNWISSRWIDSDEYHPIPIPLTGTSNFITGTTPPVDLNTLIPLANSAVIDAAQANLPAVSGHPVNYQLNPSFIMKPRAANGAASDLGAIER